MRIILGSIVILFGFLHCQKSNSDLCEFSSNQHLDSLLNGGVKCAISHDSIYINVIIDFYHAREQLLNELLANDIIVELYRNKTINNRNLYISIIDSSGEGFRYNVNKEKYQEIVIRRLNHPRYLKVCSYILYNIPVHWVINANSSISILTESLNQFDSTSRLIPAVQQGVVYTMMKAAYSRDEGITDEINKRVLLFYEGMFSDEKYWPSYGHYMKDVLNIVSE